MDSLNVDGGYSTKVWRTISPLPPPATSFRVFEPPMKSSINQSIKSSNIDPFGHRYNVTDQPRTFNSRPSQNNY